MAWLVVQVRPRELHVLPCDEDERVVLGHRPAITCFCHPSAERDGPLDDPIWSHHEPSWPGAREELVN
jgi:hypothetical protein